MDKLIDILKGILPEVDFINNKNLVNDGLLDSIDIVNIITAIENEYGIIIDPNDVDPDSFQSAVSIFEMIKRNS